MTNYSVRELKERVNELALKIDAPEHLLPGFGQEIWDAHSYVQVDSNGFIHYFISERDQEIKRKITNKIDEILYWIFADVTFSMSVQYELFHRMDHKDFRRVIFDKQEELLGELNQGWKEKEHAEHKRILASYPFDDLAGLNAKKNFEDFYCHIRNEFPKIKLLDTWDKYDWSLNGNDNSIIMSELCVEMASWVAKSNQTETKYFMDIIENYFNEGDISLTSIIYSDFLVTVMELKTDIRDVIRVMMGVETKTHYKNLLNFYKEASH